MDGVGFLFRLESVATCHVYQSKKKPDPFDITPQTGRLLRVAGLTDQRPTWPRGTLAHRVLLRCLPARSPPTNRRASHRATTAPARAAGRRAIRTRGPAGGSRPKRFPGHTTQ